MNFSYYLPTKILFGFGALKGLGEEVVTLGARKRSEEHTSELQSLAYLVCRLLLEKKKKKKSRSKSITQSGNNLTSRNVQHQLKYVKVQVGHKVRRCLSIDATHDEEVVRL